MLPYQDYQLTAWVQTTSNVTDAYIGARTADFSSIINETDVDGNTSYTQVTCDFNSGANTSVTVYGGYLDNVSGGSYMRMDDFSLTPVP